MHVRHKQRPAVDVLIAEDDAVTRMALRQLLEAEGYTCAEAEDGQEAVEIARQCHPRLARLDLMMPRLDGLAAARQLQADPRTRGVHIHCLTGRDDPAAHRQARQAGCEGFLTKPLDPTGVLDLVTLALST